MSLTPLPAWATGLISEARVAHLALRDADDRPRVLPVTFALAEGAAWTAVDQKPKRSAEPARVRWLRQRPEAALVADRYSDDWEQLAWVQLLGRVAVLGIDEPAAAPGLEALTHKYEPYRELSPPGPLLRLEVERALCWRACD